MAAFQLIGDQYSTGLFGTDGFGTSAFGGTAYTPYALELHVPADDVSEDNRKRAGRMEHRRYGILVGLRHYATARRWRIHMEAIQQADLNALMPYYEAGRFYLLQDEDETGRRVEVAWLGEFEPENLRGGFYNIDFMVEEIL